MLASHVADGHRHFEFWLVATGATQRALAINGVRVVSCNEMTEKQWQYG